MTITPAPVVLFKVLVLLIAMAFFVTTSANFVALAGPFAVGLLVDAEVVVRQALFDPRLMR